MVERDVGPYGIPVSWVTTALVTSFSMAVTELGGVALSRKYGSEQKDFTLKNLVVVGAIALFQVRASFIPNPILSDSYQFVSF
jgi:hypothetical protein